MLYETEHGVYLFEYDRDNDSSAISDYLQDSIEVVFEIAEEDYGVKPEEWQEIPDPLEHCQDDWIEPVRIVGRDKGKPEWGKLEKLVSGSWVPIIE